MLTGYTDRLSARPGETLSFMVSTDAGAFEAQIVRLIHGDADPRGPGRREIPVEAAANGTHRGTLQPIYPGSYVTVHDHASLRLGGDFTIFAWVRPTRLASGEQVLLAKGGPDGAGYTLGLSGSGRLFLRIGPDSIECAAPLSEGRWHWIAVRYEAAHRSARLSAGLHRRDLSLVEGLGARGRLPNVVGSGAPMTIAASVDGGRARAVFNGLIADPCIFGRCLSGAEIAWLAGSADMGALPRPCLAAWDFSLACSSRTVRDVGGQALDGTTHQAPVRLMTGPHWTGENDDPRSDRRSYSAIHFHEDSLSDAAWRESFAFEVPAGLESGVYAARLVAGEEVDHLPFIVCPPRGEAAAPLALVMPTFTYMAYGNEMCGEYGLNCAYDHYADGAGVPLASSRHPVKTFRPGRGLLRSVTGESFGRHLCADLYLIDWLNAIGQSVDVVTDHQLHREGQALLRSYQGVLTGSHPEYVSGAMLDALEAYLSGGGCIGYLGGNGFYSVTSLSDDGCTIEVRRPNGSRPWSSNPGEGHHAMTGEIGGLWRFRGRAPQRLVGVGFTAQGWTSRDACGLPRAYEQADRAHPLAEALLAGIAPGEAIGDFETLGLGIGAAGDEIDRADFALGTPAHAVIVATARGFPEEYQLTIEEREAMTEASALVGDPRVRSDIVCFETSRGGFVFSAGSMQWCSALCYDGYDNTVARMTRNVIERMLGRLPSP